MFLDGQTDVHDEEQSIQSSVVRDDLVENVNKKICLSCLFTVLERSCEFPQISHTLST
jgi:hypothetical protein